MQFAGRIFAEKYLLPTELAGLGPTRDLYGLSLIRIAGSTTKKTRDSIGANRHDDGRKHLVIIDVKFARAPSGKKTAANVAKPRQCPRYF
jgi:hypothetical protein